MVGLRNNTLAGVKRLVASGGSSDRKLAETYIYANNIGMLLWRGISYLDL